MICEAGVARVNENSYSNRGEISAAASELFGAIPLSFTMVREPGGERRWSPWDRTWGEFLESTSLKGAGELNGKEALANVYIQTFDAVDSAPCLFFEDKIAGTVRRNGKGKAWLLGTYVGHNGTAYRNKGTQEFVATLMKRCNVLPVHSGELLVRKRRIKDKEAWIVTNPTDHEVTEVLRVGDWSTATDLFEKSLEIADKRTQLSVGSLDVKVVLLYDPKEGL